MRRVRRLRGVRLGAAAAVLALLGVAVSASVATADNASTPVAGLPGYVSGLPGDQYTQSGSTITGPMPGNLPGTATFTSLAGSSVTSVIRYTNPPAPTGWSMYAPFVLTSASSVAMTQLPSNIRSCLNSLGTAYGTLQYCTTYNATLTFTSPVVDPVILFDAGSEWTDKGTNTPRGQTADYQGCLRSFTTAGISQVNGASPTAGQVSLINSDGWQTGSWSYTVANNDIVPSGTFTAPGDGTCVTTAESNAGQSFEFKVTGLVTSVQLDFPVYFNISKTLASGYVSSSSTWAAWPGASWYGFAVPSTDLSVTKTAASMVPVGGTIDWGLTVTNNSSSIASHGFVVQDAVPASVTNPRLVNAPAGCVLSGTSLLCGIAPTGYSIAAPPGSSPTTASVLTALSGTNTSSVGTVLDPGGSVTIQLAGDVPLTASGTVPNTATVSGTDLDPNTGNNTSTVTTAITPPTWTLAKTATVGGVAPANGVVKPGDVITYTVTATSKQGTVAGAVISDDLSKVLKNATFNAGSATLQVGSAAPVAVPDPSGNPATLATPSFTLPDGQSATLSYQVTVNQGAWLATLTNTATATSGGGSTPSCDPTCSTTSKTGALILITKTGLNSAGASVPVDGAAFQVLADDNGTPGSAVAGTPVTAVSGQTGGFQTAGLMPGTYWLKETAAPKGYELLAQPVAFTVGSSGTVAVVDASANPNVTASGNTLTVGDAPALKLPFTGASGSGGAACLAGGGLAVLAALALTAAMRRRRPRSRTVRG